MWSRSRETLELHVIVALLSLSTKTLSTNTRLDHLSQTVQHSSHHARSPRDNETQVSQTPRQPLRLTLCASNSHTSQTRLTRHNQRTSHQAHSLQRRVHIYHLQSTHKGNAKILNQSNQRRKQFCAMVARCIYQALTQFWSCDELASQT
jgi:hypothetical protein